MADTDFQIGKGGGGGHGHPVPAIRAPRASVSSKNDGVMAPPLNPPWKIINGMLAAIAVQGP